jgi:hypothetical protein
LGAYHPRIWAFKEWRPIPYLIGRRIGVGYKDHGSLSTAPSWKDQMVLTEEGTEEKFDSVLSELRTLLLFSEYSQESGPPTDEPQSGRKGRKKE